MERWLVGRKRFGIAAGVVALGALGSAAFSYAHDIADNEITACVSDDGCCPAGCNAGNDRDCAIKCDDGAGRAAEVVLAGLILRLLRLEEADHAALAPLARPILRNWNGIEIGMLRATEILAQHT